MTGLDLCAGCGVVGLDLLFHFHQNNQMPFKKFDFLEVQEVYKSHFEINKKNLLPIEDRLNLLIMNYSKLREKDFSEKYDLIVSNPPFFSPSQGKLSPSEFKNRCRFFMDASFETLIQGVENSLKMGGQAYLLIRNLKSHGIDFIALAQDTLSPSAELSLVGDIRGTRLVKITKITRL